MAFSWLFPRTLYRVFFLAFSTEALSCLFVGFFHGSHMVAGLGTDEGGFVPLTRAGDGFSTEAICLRG